MTHFSSPSLLTRLLCAVSLLFVTADFAQAQVNLYNLTLSPDNGVVNTPVIIRSFDLIGNAQNGLVQTGNALTLTGSSAGATPGATAVPFVLSGSGTDLSITFTVPIALAPGTYTVLVSNLDVLGLTITSSVPATFTVNVGAPLPVQLTTFTAEAAGSGARLRWATASEKDNAHFDIEASTDGRTFARVGQVAGHGTTQQPQQYAFSDENLARYAASLVYYRLRQVDGDGASTFSQVRTVAAAGGKPVLLLYPTVAADGQAPHYAYAGPELAAGAVLEVYSLAGQRVLTQPLGDGTGTLDSQALAAGWYWVRLTGAAPVRFYHQ